jgi:isocitrate/isopropylmalate dehydrogenase
LIRLALLPGDGVGAEVLSGPAQLLAALGRRASIETTGPWPIGTTAYAQGGQALPETTLAACEASDAVLLGAIGDHPGIDVGSRRTEEPLLRLREHFDLRVSIRQVWRPDAQPLTIVRNLLGGAYGLRASHRDSSGVDPASDLIVLEPERIEELAELACDMALAQAGSALVSVDKANLWATSRLWRAVTTAVAERRGMPIVHRLVDRYAFELAQRALPNAVIVTEGIFGDILSDLAAGRAGSIALCASASVHPGAASNGRCVGLFEPLHGTAPHLAGTNRANPIGAYLALAAAAAWFKETALLAGAITDAVREVVRTGRLTYDLAAIGSDAATTEELSARMNRYCLNAFDRREAETAAPDL